VHKLEEVTAGGRLFSPILIGLNSPYDFILQDATVASLD
jgi:hypothetical protein